jgi:hypothetical protein
VCGALLAAHVAEQIQFACVSTRSAIVLIRRQRAMSIIALTTIRSSRFHEDFERAYCRVRLLRVD